MADKRADDFGRAHNSWYRSDRMIEQGGQWYFQTREGTIEGPYGCRFEAINALEAFIEAKALGLLSPDADLNLTPLDTLSVDLKR